MSRSSSPGLSVEDITLKVNAELPAHVSPAVIAINPEFSGLLLSLTNHLQLNSLTNERNEELEKAKQDYKLEHHSYLQTLVCYSAIKELVIDQQLKKNKIKFQCMDTLMKRVNLSELQCSLKTDIQDNSEDSNVLGLSSATINSYKPELEKKAVDALEKHLKTNLNQIAVLLNEEITMKENRLVESHLPTFVENKILSAAQKQKELDFEKLTQSNLLNQFQNVFQESLELIELLIRDYRLQLFNMSNKLAVKHSIVTTKAIMSKMKIVESQLTSNLYDSKSVIALDRIKKYLVENKEQDEKKHYTMTQTLKMYKAIGSEFKSILAQYTAVQEEIKNRTWALRELS